MILEHKKIKSATVSTVSTVSPSICHEVMGQISQEAGQVVWYSHLFQNFPQLIVIYIVKGFGIVNEAEIDVFSGTLLLFR